MEEKILMELDPHNEDQLRELIENPETYGQTLIELIRSLWVVKELMLPEGKFEFESEFYTMKVK